MTNAHDKCPQCGGPLEVRAPDQTQRIACPYCGSLLDTTKDLAVLEALARPEFEPGIPLGSRSSICHRSSPIQISLQIYGVAKCRDR